ncbi:MAG: hypothetical protein J6K81_04635 [Rikenellaceae bacterium]|nr:hypothetical protein [Rikenellaceae bacterium]
MTNSNRKGVALNIARTVIRIAVGVLFCLSAKAKISDFDHLELYIFSFGVLSLNVSFWVARLLVAFEAVLGLALIANIRHRAITWTALGAVVAFSAFLLYAIAEGRNDNCHCMGEMVEMTPWQSLAKNAALAVALLFMLPQRGGVGFRKWVWVAVSVVVTLAIFIASPPDNINPHRRYDKVLNESYYDSLPHSEGRRVVCFYSTSCKYCELASSKIASIARRHGVEHLVDVWFADLGGNTDSLVRAFYNRTLSPSFPYRTLEFRQFLTTTNGQMPVILLTDDNSVVTEFNYRTIDEQTILKHLLSQD